MSQLPNPTTPPTNQTEENVTTIQDVCDAYGVDPSPDSGGAAGGVMSDIPDGTIKSVSGLEGEIYVGGKKIGQVDQLVYIQDYPFTVEMAPYLISMINAAKADGVNLRISSGFRTMSKQKSLYARPPDMGGKGGKTATPGHSPHQCGLAVDFSTKGARYNAQWEWLCKNAYRYGFIRRVRSERWHFEYLGTWPGQEIPDYAVKWAAYRGSPNIWGSGMFTFVYRDGSNAVHMSDRHKWGEGGRSSGHPDWTHPNSKPNTWTNWAGEILPDKFDLQDPGWDRRTATPPPLPDDELGESDPPDLGESEQV